jgi:DNA-binding NtrC family response regulator
MQIDQELRDKLLALERIDQINSADVKLLELKFELLHDIALRLVEEIESLGSVRTVNLSRGISLPDEIRAFETHLIQSALERTGGHQTKAAQLLGINLTTLHNKLKRLNISPEPVVEAPILHEDLPFGFSPSESRVN